MRRMLTDKTLASRQFCDTCMLFWTFSGISATPIFEMIELKVKLLM